MEINFLNEKIYYFCEDNSKPLVVYIHGLGGKAEFAENLLKFDNRKYRILCFDLAGRGKSTFNDPISVNKWLENIYYVLDHLNIRDFYLLAHSFGCYLATEIMNSKKYNVINNVLVAPYNPYIPTNSPLGWKISSIYPKNFTSLNEAKSLYENYIDKELAKTLLITDYVTYFKNKELMLSFIDEDFYKTRMMNSYKTLKLNILAGIEDPIASLESCIKTKILNKDSTILKVDGGHDIIITQIQGINNFLNNFIENDQKK